MNPARPACTTLLLLAPAAARVRQQQRWQQRRDPRAGRGRRRHGHRSGRAGWTISRRHESCVLNCDPKCTEAQDAVDVPGAGSTGARSRTTRRPAATSTARRSRRRSTASAPRPRPRGAAPSEKTNTAATPPVLPDGRRIEPAGNEWRLHRLPGGFPDGALLASRARVAPRRRHRLHDALGARGRHGDAPDAGEHDARHLEHQVRPARALNWGMAYVAASKVLYVASGYDSSADALADLRLRLRHDRRQAHRRRGQERPAAQRHLPQGDRRLARRQDAARRAGEGQPRPRRQPRRARTYGKVTGRHRRRRSRRLRDPLRSERRRPATPRTPRSGSRPSSVTDSDARCASRSSTSRA